MGEWKRTATAAAYIITETETNTEMGPGTRREKCADPTGHGRQSDQGISHLKGF